MTKPNAEMTERWNGPMFDKWLRFEELLTKGMSKHSDAALVALPPPRGGRVLDIGCGLGDLTVALAERVGPEGSAVGVDLAQRMVDHAAKQAAAVPNARFFAADVQVADLGGPYDVAYSRMGVMFFDDPPAAFANVRRALRPDGRIAWVVWRRRADNPFVETAFQAVSKILPPAPDATPSAEGAPGPFGMVDADRVSDHLRAAGFRRIGFERSDVPMVIGRTIDEAVDYGMTMGPAGELVRLAGDEGVRRRSEVEAALRAVYAPLVHEGRVEIGTSAWIVTATA